jgi:hypothetical protein
MFSYQVWCGRSNVVFDAYHETRPYVHQVALHTHGGPGEIVGS